MTNATTGGAKPTTGSSHPRGLQLWVRTACDGALIAALTLAVWWAPRQLEFNPPLDVGDLFKEVPMLLAAGVGYWFVRRLGVPAMTVGWTLIVAGLLIDVLDEFNGDLALFDVGQPVVLIGGFLMAALGLYGSQLALRRQLDRAVKAERHSEVSQRRFRALFQEAPVGYWELDLDGTIGRANAAAHRLLGAPDEALEGENLKFFLAEGANGEALDCPKEHQQCVDGRVLELELQNSDGRPRTVLAHQNAIRADDGTLVGSRMALVDVTEQRRTESEKERLERQLQHSQRLETIGTLAGGIAHDFNNLLVPILGNLEFALEEIPSDSGLHGDLEEAEAAAKRAKELVRQILTFSKKGDRRLQPVRVQDVVKEVSGLLKHTLPSTIEIITKPEMETPIVDADQGQLHQVLMNLCANAAHAMDQEGGRLTLSIGPLTVGEGDESRIADLPPGLYAHLSVIDTGVGMDRSTLEKIFDPFFTTRGTNGGTGLGLSVVHGIISGFDGFIVAESVVGVGSNFQIFLPASERGAPEPAKPVERVSPKSNGARGKRILLVDDEPSVLSLTDRMLSRGGYEVSPHLRSPEALEQFCEDPDGYDLVMTDQTMPKLTGVELAQAVHELSPGTPVVLMSGNDTAIPRESAEAAGVTTVLEKPIPFQELLEAVEGVIQSS